MSDSAIHIETKLDKASVDAAAEAVVKVMKAGFECHLDQETIVEGIHAVRGALAPAPVSVNNCSFVQNQPETTGPAGVHIIRVPLGEDDPRQPGDKGRPERDEDPLGLRDHERREGDRS